MLTVLTPATSDGAPLPSRAAVRRPSGLAVTGVLALAAGLLAAVPALSLVGTVLSATAVARRRTSILEAVPLAATVVLGVAIAIGTAAGLLGVRPVDHGWLVAAVQAALAVAALPLSGTTHHAPVPRSTLVALVPAALAALVGALQMASPVRAAGWSLISTDIAEHVVLLGEVQRAGGLEYGADATYPRGLHLLLALASAVRPAPAGSPELLRADLALWAAVSWLCFALFLWAAVPVTRAAARAASAPGRVEVLATVAVPWILLGSLDVQVALVHLGAAPVLLALVALWLVPLSAARDLSPPVQLLIAGTGLLVVAHQWQPLVAGPALAMVWIVWRTVTAAPGGLRALMTSPLVWTTVALAALALPPFLAVSSSSGLEIAGYFGEIPGPPVTVLLLALAAVVSAARGRGLSTTLPLAFGLLLAVGVLLAAAGGGLDLSQYYPRKALWLFALFLAPLGAAPATALLWRHAGRLWEWLGGLPSTARLTRIAVAAAAAALCFGLVAPGTAGPNSILRAASVGGEDFAERRLAIATADHAGPGVVVVPSAVALSVQAGQPGPFIVSKLLRFRTGQERSFGDPAELCVEVDGVAAGRPSLVITDLDAAVLQEVAERQGCGPIEVKTLPGGHPPAIEAFEQALLRH